MTIVWNVDNVAAAKATGITPTLSRLLDGFELRVGLDLLTYGWDGWKKTPALGLEIVPTAAKVRVRTKGGEVDLGIFLAAPGSRFLVGESGLDRQVIYCGHLSRVGLHRLEEQRDGSPIEFDVWAHAMAFVGGGVRGAAGRLVAEPLVLHLSKKTASDTWHSMVAAAGGTSSIIVEIPIPSEVEFPELEHALAHLRKAIDERGRGDSTNAIATCRVALDDLEQRGFGGHAPEDVIRFLKQSAKRLTLSERFSMVQAALTLAVSPAHHAGASRADLGRFDAQFAVTSVAALLALAPYRGRPPEPEPAAETAGKENDHGPRTS